MANLENLIILMRTIRYDKNGNNIYATLDYNGRKKKVSVTSRDYLNYVTKMFYTKTNMFYWFNVRYLVRFVSSFVKD